MSDSVRNPALCIRCNPEWRRWVRVRSRQLGVNESSLIEMACAWFAVQCGFPDRSPAVWYPESSPRYVSEDDNRYKDSALYLNVTPEWKTWISKLGRSQRRSTSWMIEESLAQFSQAQGAASPPPRTSHFTHALR